MSKMRGRKRVSRRDYAKIPNAAIKYDHEGCDVCGHRPIGREVYPVGLRGSRVVGVCHKHFRSLDVIIGIQFFMESERNKKRREMTEAVSTDGPKH
jgi:hypothetical protein